MKKEIPNIITLCNLLCGCASVLCTFSADLVGASAFIFLAAVFDFFDGMAARMLKVSGAMGTELDSLSDVVSFGVAPSFIAFHMMFSQNIFPRSVCFLAFVIAAASAYRLAAFNTDKTQHISFKGMPTPANAIFWASLNLYWAKKGVVLNAWYILFICLLSACLLICSLRMFSFKGRDFSWSARRFVYIYLIVAVVFFCIWGFLGLAIDILLYPVFSYLHFRFDALEEKQLDALEEKQLDTLEEKQQSENPNLKNPIEN